MHIEDIATKQDLEAIKELIQSIQVNEPEEVFTPEDAAAYLKVTTKTLENWRNGRTQKNPLQAYGQGRVVRYLKSDCIKFLKQHPM